MSLPVLDLLAGMFFNIFGNGLIIMTVLAFTMITILLAMRADISVILMILIPLLAGLLLNVAGSNFISLPPWILIVIFIIAGFIFSFTKSSADLNLI